MSPMEVVGWVASLITICSLVWTFVDQHTVMIARFFFPRVKGDFTNLENEISRVHALLGKPKATTTSICFSRSSAMFSRDEDLLLRFESIRKRVESFAHTKDSVLARVHLYVFRGSIKQLQKELQALDSDIQNGTSVTRSVTFHKISRKGRLAQSFAQRCKTRESTPSQGLMRRVDPAGMLEQSSDFYPESYASPNLPEIVIKARHETSFTRSSNVNLYEILCLKKPRTWISIDVSLDIPRRSRYWKFTEMSNHRLPHYNPVFSFCLPMNLYRELIQRLQTLESLQSGSHVHIQVADATKNALKVTKVQNLQDGTDPRRATSYTKTSTLECLYHMGCPIVNEREVVRLGIIELPRRFSASFRGKHVQEVLSAGHLPSHNFRYTIELLHRLRAEAGFVRLVGVVVEEPTHFIKSYLLEWPDAQYELLLHRASNPSLPYNWWHVERWSRQLLERLRAVHTAGAVVGTLRWQRPPVFVDANDDLHLWHFDTRIAVSPTTFPFYPPEFRYLAQSWRQCATRSNESLVTPAYDVYQCGQLLWMLAAAWASNETSALEFKMAFYKPSDSNHTGIWFGPNPLPRLPKMVPEWFQGIIDLCCATKDRLSCNNLLELFPPDPSKHEVKTYPKTSDLDDMITAMRACRLMVAYCDRCYQQISTVSFDCSICNAGDFYVCSTCFAEGQHCDDNEHRLVELGSDRYVAPTTTRYHSSPGLAGNRRTFTL